MESEIRLGFGVGPENPDLKALEELEMTRRYAFEIEVLRWCCKPWLDRPRRRAGVCIFGSDSVEFGELGMKEEVTGDYYNIGVVTVKRNESNCRRTAAAEGKTRLMASRSFPTAPFRCSHLWASDICTAQENGEINIQDKLLARWRSIADITTLGEGGSRGCWTRLFLSIARGLRTLHVPHRDI